MGSPQLGLPSILELIKRLIILRKLRLAQNGGLCLLFQELSAERHFAHVLHVQALGAAEFLLNEAQVIGIGKIGLPRLVTESDYFCGTEVFGGEWLAFVGQKGVAFIALW